MTDNPGNEQSLGVSLQGPPSEGWSRFSGVWFAVIVAPAIGVLAIVALAFAHVVVFAGAIVGIAVAAIATVIRMRSRGMPAERAYGLAVLAMFATAGIVMAVVVAVVVAYGLVMKDF